MVRRIWNVCISFVWLTRIILPFFHFLSKQRVWYPKFRCNLPILELHLNELMWCVKLFLLYFCSQPYSITFHTSQPHNLVKKKIKNILFYSFDVWWLALWCICPNISEFMEFYNIGCTRLILKLFTERN